MKSLTKNEQLREELSEKIYHWLYVQAHPEYTATKMSKKAERFADEVIAMSNKALLDKVREQILEKAEPNPTTPAGEPELVPVSAIEALWSSYEQ